MANIDLIPEEYHYWLWQCRCFKVSGLVGAGVIALCIALSLQFGAMKAGTESELARIQSQQEISQSQQSRLEFVRNEQQALESQWALLNGLRGGTTVEHLFEAIDRALNGDAVWFERWNFMRRGNVASSDRIQQYRDGGAHIIELSRVPGDDMLLQQAWAISTHLSVQGGADDHAALSEFVERMLQQQRIVAVKVLNTALMQQSEGEAISFTLSVTINNAAEVKS